MKKTLIALAVAGVVAAPAAMAEVTVYGLAHVSLDNVSSDAGDTSLAVTSRASRVGVKASEDLGGGLKAIAQMEWQVDMADAAGSTGACDTTVDDTTTPISAETSCKNGNISSRNQIVGLAGGFGTIAVGRHDTPYKMSTGSLDVFADTAADYNFIIGTPAGLENRADNAVAYLSPDMSGFSVQAAVVAADVPDASGDDANAADATSVALQYKNGPLFVAVASETFEDEVATGGGKGQSGVRAGVGYDLGVAKIGFTFETASDVGAADDDYTGMVVNAAIPVGGSNTIIAEYGTATTDQAASGAPDLDRSIAAVGFAHSFSKASSGYVAYGTTSTDAFDTTTSTKSTVDTNVLTAGMVVKF